MSWTAPVTFVTGNILTASQLNTYLRDNTLALRGAPRCRVHMSADQAIPTSTLTELVFDVEDIDTHGMHSGSSGHVTVPAGWAGDYVLIGLVAFEGDTATLRREGEIQVNDAVKIAYGDTNPSTDPGQTATFGISTLWFPTSGDFFNLKCLHDRGSDLNALADGYSGCHLAAYFVGSGAG